MHVVRAEIKDAVAISKLHIEAERETYGSTIPSLLENVSDINGRIHLWRSALNRDWSSVFCLMAIGPSGDLTGFLSGRISTNEKSARFSSIYLLRRYQRKGFGRRLLATFAQEACHRGTLDIVTVVPAGNIGARCFLNWCGGLETSSEAFTYQDTDVKMVHYKWNNLPQLVSYFQMLE